MKRWSDVMMEVEAMYEAAEPPAPPPPPAAALPVELRVELVVPGPAVAAFVVAAAPLDALLDPPPEPAASSSLQATSPIARTADRRSITPPAYHRVGDWRMTPTLDS